MIFVHAPVCPYRLVFSRGLGCMSIPAHRRVTREGIRRFDDHFSFKRRWYLIISSSLQVGTDKEIS